MFFFSYIISCHDQLTFESWITNHREIPTVIQILWHRPPGLKIGHEKTKLLKKKLFQVFQNVSSI
jgi:hypothetical protein